MVDKKLNNVLMAYVWASGLIEFGNELPEGALPVASSRNHQQLKDVVTVLARHSRTSRQLLVPGIPEATDQNAGRIALVKFCILVESHLIDEVKKNGKSNF
ncbi:TPA: host nuclease inhibitor protein [Citrobacter amalonaticus]